MKLTLRKKITNKKIRPDLRDLDFEVEDFLSKRDFNSWPFPPSLEFEVLEVSQSIINKIDFPFDKDFPWLTRKRVLL